MSQRRLMRSNDNRIIAGVCSGIGNYIGVDPTIVRVVWVLTCVLAGTGLLAYLICAIIIPSETAYTPYE